MEWSQKFVIEKREKKNRKGEKIKKRDKKLMGKKQIFVTQEWKKLHRKRKRKIKRKK